MTNDPFALRPGDRVDTTESIVELALDDMSTGRVGAIATSQYVDGNHDWTKRYESALAFHGHKRVGGSICKIPAVGIWDFILNRRGDVA